ncbi:MAG: hypothetical protein DRQ44_07075 [Gammaproteobacteria bacterium]|nr:MAG: hypothetical protein DRQ44_07075 [Gammaproteobacteria bacterium]
MKLILLSLIILVVNIPFGYWRARVDRFSWRWFLAIHIPVLIVIALRLVSHLGFAWYTYVVFVTAFFFGQKIGGLLVKRERQRGQKLQGS